MKVGMVASWGERELETSGSKYLIKNER